MEKIRVNFAIWDTAEDVCEMIRNHFVENERESFKALSLIVKVKEKYMSLYKEKMKKGTL